MTSVFTFFMMTALVQEEKDPGPEDKKRRALGASG
jgi:hypothetical protein